MEMRLQQEQMARHLERVQTTVGAIKEAAMKEAQKSSLVQLRTEQKIEALRAEMDKRLMEQQLVAQIRELQQRVSGFERPPRQSSRLLQPLPRGDSPAVPLAATPPSMQARGDAHRASRPARSETDGGIQAHADARLSPPPSPLPAPAPTVPRQVKRAPVQNAGAPAPRPLSPKSAQVKSGAGVVTQPKPKPKPKPKPEPKNNSQRTTRRASAAGPLALPDGFATHFFVSHSQSTGGDQANAIYLELTMMGFSGTWVVLASTSPDLSLKF